MDNQTMLVFTFDGDEIGKRHAKAILSDNLEQVREVSEHITEGNNFIRQFVESHGGEWVSGGGDEGSFTAPEDFLNHVEEMRKDYEYLVQATLSVGYGETISQAGKALLVAKERGKNQVVKYDDSVEQEVKELKEYKDSDENSEKKKIKDVLSDEGKQENSTENEPTLSEPPKQYNNHGYDSGYKNSDPGNRIDSYQENDLTPPVMQKPNLRSKPPIEEATSTDIPESDRAMNNELPDPKDKEAKDKKPAPKDYHGQAEVDAPESMAQPSEKRPSDLKYNNEEEQEHQGTNEPGMPIENATTDEAEETEEEHMLGDKHCPSCTCEEHGESIEDILNQHLENAKDFSDSLENQDDNADKENVEEILDAHIDNATDMQQEMDQNGVSRPEDYNEKNRDMGLSEENSESDEPKLDEVLKDGLDAHADSIHKEKVMNMVGEALEGFKSQKQILDKAKEQAPELYNSCIAMLKAMIELCSLAGIDEGHAEQDVNEIEGQGESPEETPAPKEESCPNCGHQKEKEAAPKEGSHESPQQ